VSGRASSALTGDFEFSLTWEVLGELPVVQTQTPDVTDDDGSADFSGLSVGAYTPRTRSMKDAHEVAVLLNIPAPFDDE